MVRAIKYTLKNVVCIGFDIILLFVLLRVTCSRNVEKFCTEFGGYVIKFHFYFDFFLFYPCRRYQFFPRNQKNVFPIFSTYRIGTLVLVCHTSRTAEFLLFSSILYTYSLEVSVETCILLVQSSYI